MTQERSTLRSVIYVLLIVILAPMALFAVLTIAGFGVMIYQAQQNEAQEQEHVEEPVAPPTRGVR